MPLTEDQKKAIKYNELSSWEAEEYRLQLRYEVHKDLGNQDQVKVIEDQLVALKKALKKLKE